MRSTAARSLTKAARQSTGHCALYVVAVINPQQPYGRNRPLSPIRFGVSENPRNIGNLAQQWNHEETSLVASLWTDSRHEAERVREKLEGLLCEDDVLIRGSWYDMPVEELLSLMRFAAQLCFVEVFTEAERQERLQVAIAESLGRKRQRVGRFV